MSAMLPVFHAGAPGALPTPPGGPRGELGEEAERPGDAAEKAPRRKRVITAARKEQNRIAQKAFRQRQKERRQQSEGRPAPTHPQLRPRPEAPSQEDCSRHGISESGRSSVQDSSDPEVDFFAVGPCPLCGASGTSPSALASSSGDSHSHSHSSSPDSLGVELVNGNATGTSPGTMPYSKTLADPHVNAIEFLPTTIFTALLHNALSLGFNLEDLSGCGIEGISPFFRQSTPQDDPSALLSSAIQGLPGPPPEHLRPTLTQVLIPHHPSLDLLPLPHLRDRAIALSAAMPHIFNIWELKLDVYTRGGLGMVKQKVGKDGMARSCQPWERSSWVAAPWFLRKWSMIVAEERGQLSFRETQVEQLT